MNKSYLVSFGPYFFKSLVQYIYLKKIADDFNFGQKVVLI